MENDNETLNGVGVPSMQGKWDELFEEKEGAVEEKAEKKRATRKKTTRGKKTTSKKSKVK